MPEQAVQPHSPAPDAGHIKARKRIAESTRKPTQRRDRTPPAYSRRDRSRSPRRQSPEYRRRDQRPRSPSPIRRSPTPERSPPRQRKRPGGASRISASEKEAVRQRQEQREREREEANRRAAQLRGVGDVVRQHYNAVPERGRDWRKTDSKIKGLRNYNNWVKSVIIQKFSPKEGFEPNSGYGGPDSGILVLDIGCGKGGDLGKWQQAPQRVDLYVGVDPADISINQARDRYAQMRRGRGGRPQRTFQAEFYVKDGFGEWLGDVPIVREVGIDGSVGPGAGGAIAARWGGGGFDVVSMMFCMHYAFESEEKARGMLRNVAGSLKKGGRFIGVIPNSDVLTDKAEKFHKQQKEKLGANANTAPDGEENSSGANGDVEKKTLEWGNGIYRVKFPGDTPEDGIFRPPFGWKYFYFLEEAVEEVPEYVVPWFAFRA